MIKVSMLERERGCRGRGQDEGETAAKPKSFRGGEPGCRAAIRRQSITIFPEIVGQNLSAMQRQTPLMSVEVSGVSND